MSDTQLQEAPPRATPPFTSLGLSGGGNRFIDCLIDLLIACESEIQNNQRDWIVETMRQTKAQLLTLAVTFFYDTNNLALNHYCVDREPVVLVTLHGTQGARFTTHLWWTSFGESAINKIVRHVFKGVPVQPSRRA